MSSLKDGPDHLYTLSTPEMQVEYDSATLEFTEGSAETGSSTKYPKPPQLPPRNESTYHYEEPDPALFDTGMLLDNNTIPYQSADALIINDIDEGNTMTIFKIVAIALSVFTISFCGGLAGGAAVAPAAAHAACSCANGSVSFFLQQPSHGSCWHVADGNDAELNMLTHGGLYIRSGTLGAIGTVLESATSADNLTVETYTDPATFSGLIGAHDTGVELPRHFRLSGQAVEASHGSLQGWAIKPNAMSNATVRSVASETRPVSIVLLPAVCIHT